MKIVSVKSTDWHTWRNKGIGASDAAAACGASKYKSRYQLWLEKTGQSNGRAMNERMQWGLWLEPVIGKAYCDRTGINLDATQLCCEHPQYPWMRATIDAHCNGKLVEFKAVGFETGRRLGEDGDSDSLPTEWLLQKQHQLAVADYEWGDVAVFLGHLLELRIYPVQRNDELIATLIESESEFWESVQSKNAPTPETIEDYIEWTKRSGGKGTRIAIEDPRIIKACNQYDEDAYWIADKKDNRDIMKREILAALSGHEYGDLPDGRVIRAQVIEVQERVQTVKAHTQLRLTIREPRRHE